MIGLVDEKKEMQEAFMDFLHGVATRQSHPQ
jgi:hypothetical protein